MFAMPMVALIPAVVFADDIYVQTIFTSEKNLKNKYRGNSLLRILDGNRIRVLYLTMLCNAGARTHAREGDGDEAGREAKQGKGNEIKAR